MKLKIIFLTINAYLELFLVHNVKDGMRDDDQGWVDEHRDVEDVHVPQETFQIHTYINNLNTDSEQKNFNLRR